MAEVTEAGSKARGLDDEDDEDDDDDAVDDSSPAVRRAE